MRLFRRRFATTANTNERKDQQQAPARPPRTRAHTETVRKYKEEFEQVRLLELAKVNNNIKAVMRSGSVMIRLDTEVLQSQKQRNGGPQDLIAQPSQLSGVLSQPFLRTLFRTFLKTKHAGESLMLFETIELFNSVNAAEWRCKVAEGIMERFVLDTAEFSVNISARDRGELVARYKTEFWPEQSFASVMREMYDLMSQNYFQAFCLAYAPWPLDITLAASAQQRIRRGTSLIPQQLAEDDEVVAEASPET